MGAGFVVDVSKMAFSPDGSHLAFTADFDSNNEDALYVVPVDASTAPVRVSPIPPPTGNVTTFLWLSNTELVFAGDVLTQDVNGLWYVDVTVTDPALNNVELLSASLLSDGFDVVTSYVEQDDTGRVYFKSNHETDGVYRLYRVFTDGTGLEQVPGTAITVDASELGIAGWGISPDGARLAFGTSPFEGGIGQVYTLDLSQSTATQVTSFVGPPPASEAWGLNFSKISWSPDQTMLAYTGDWVLDVSDLDNVDHVFISDLVAGTTVRIMSPLYMDGLYTANECVFARDQSRLFVLGDMVYDGEVDIFITTDFVTAQQNPDLLRLLTPPREAESQATPSLTDFVGSSGAITTVYALID